MNTSCVARRARWTTPLVVLLAAVLVWPAVARGELWYDFNEPYASATGPEVKVFDWSVDRCVEVDIPDQPARAFRDVNGQVNLIAAHSTMRRKLGSTLGAVTHQCTPSFGSTASPDPATWDHGEWLAAPYTPDGQTVYALVNDEYRGWMYGPNGYCVRAGEQWADQQKCWYNGITFATSTDRGATYTHSAAPTHYVGSLPYRYEPGIGPAGFFSPSNIVRGRDGYHYVMVHVEGHGAQADGSCLWRTRDLSDRKSWRAWGGAGFTVRFLDPYPNDITDPAQHVCAPIGAGTNLGTASESLTWSTYFKQWLVVHATGGGMGTGFYSYTSDDLINWTPAKLVLNAKLPWAHTCGEPDYVLYPSLLDPDSKSRNFETTGQRPYLFFTHFNVGYNSGGCWMSIDRDLVRIPMEFSNQEPGGPAAALTASTTTARTGEPVRFDASGSRDADGTITRYQWDLDGDGAYERDTGTSPVAQRSYEAPDDVTVTVRVSDDDGKATDDTQIVRVTGPVLGSSGGAGAASAPSPAAGVPAAPARSAAIARFRVVGTPRARRDGSVSLRVRAPAAGRLLVRAAGRKLIRAARAVAARPGTLALRVKPSVRGRVLLGRRGRLRVKAAISFTPVGGVRQSESQTLTLRLARRA